MGRAQLKALLASASSIVFDARARELRPEESAAGDDAQGNVEVLPPFFDHPLLKNTILIKTVERAGVVVSKSLQTCEGPADLRTRLYFPFDNKRIGNGGMSLVHGKNFSISTIETFFGVGKIDPACIQEDMKKIAVLTGTPSFAPFLLRDAFERGGFTVDRRYFDISEAEVGALRDNLKAKLKPLAAMAMNVSATLVGNAQLDLLANKLWDLDDPRFLTPLALALKIPESDTIGVFYAWIGVSYFQREFAKRQARLRPLAEWLTSKPPFPDGTREEVVREFEDDRSQVRDRVRWAWTSAGGVFERYTTSYDALIAGGGNARPFVEYLKTVRDDFAGLGARLSVIEQCLSFYDVVVREQRGSMLCFEILRELAGAMRQAESKTGTGLAAA